MDKYERNFNDFFSLIYQKKMTRCLIINWSIYERKMELKSIDKIKYKCIIFLLFIIVFIHIGYPYKFKYLCNACVHTQHHCLFLI